MKFNFQNYEIDFLYDDLYNNIILNIENIETHCCYIKEITIDTFNKLQFEKHSNINNVRSGIYFFEKALNNQSGYTLVIYENENLLLNFKKINTLTMEFKGVLEEYFEIYCKFDIEEKVFSTEEKVMRMIEKMKGSYEYIVNVKINHIESQLNNLQNMILNISNIIGMPQQHIIENNITKVPSTDNIPSLNTVGSILRNSNIVFRDSEVTNELDEENEIEQKVEIKKNIVIQKSKKNIKELSENQTYFYDTFYNRCEEDNIEHVQEELIPKKMFIMYYQTLVQNSTIPNVMNKWYNFINNSDEHIILNIEKDYVNIFVSNHGKVFIFHSYGGLVNEISLQHYAEISSFQNSVSIKDSHIIKNNIEKIKVLFENIVHAHVYISTNSDSRVSLLNFFKKFDLFIENIM